MAMDNAMKAQVEDFLNNAPQDNSLSSAVNFINEQSAKYPSKKMSLGESIYEGLKPALTALENKWLGTLNYEREKELQQREFDYNAQQAKLNRDWEQMMRQTYYQDAANSALAAGYNPAFAMNGSASSPSGSAAHVSGHHASPASMNFGAGLTSILGIVGSLIAAGVRSSALEAAQDIRGQYTIDATKLRGNNALVIAKHYTDAGKNRAILNNQAAMERIREWKKGPEESDWYKKYKSDLDKAHRSDKRAMKKQRDKELEALEHMFD